MWNTQNLRSTLVVLALASMLALLVALALVAWVATAFAQAPATPSVLLVQHAYDGPVERAGALVRWQYTGAAMLVEWQDTTTDGIYRSGFE